MLTFSRRISDEYSVRVRFSDRSDGDASLPTFLLGERAEMTVPSQVHGAEVFTVSQPGEGNGTECDALLTTCVPIAIYGRSIGNTPIVGAIHAGWRGIRSGVIDNAMQQVRDYGAQHVRAIIGPHISTDQYEFGAVELGEVVAVVGDKAVGHTKSGKLALDLAAAVVEQLVRNSVTVDHHTCRCTAGDGRYWSHRADRDTQRGALIVDIRRSL
jgi:copper oxidase (laccase) domain-containing protein